MTRIIKPSLCMIFDEQAWQSMQPFNCYAYALNAPDMGFSAQPGILGGDLHTQIPMALTPEGLRLRLQNDGLVPVTDTHSHPHQVHLIAAWANRYERDGYHFARRDADGTWSHKDGSRAPVNRHMGFFKIRNVEKSLIRFRYPEFAGYFAVPPSGIVWQPRI